MRIKDLGRPIGRKPNVYAWGDSQLVYVYDSAYSYELIYAIQQAGKALYGAGMPVPAVGELVEIEGQTCQVYERNQGRTFADELLTVSGPEEECVGRLALHFAEAHAKIHLAGDLGVDLPKQKERFSEIIKSNPALSPEMKSAVLERLVHLPGRNNICHGDYHPFNVLQCPDGPIIIDWSGAHLGDPMADVAWAVMLCEGFRRMMPEIDKAVVRFTKIYLERYFALTGSADDQIEAWWPVVCAVRLADPVQELYDWLLEEIARSV